MKFLRDLCDVIHKADIIQVFDPFIASAHFRTLAIHNNTGCSGNGAENHTMEAICDDKFRCGEFIKFGLQCGLPLFHCYTTIHNHICIGNCLSKKLRCLLAQDPFLFFSSGFLAVTA